MTPPPRHLKITHPRKPPSSYTGSSSSSSSSSSSPDHAPGPGPAPVPVPTPAPVVPDCDVPVATTEWVDPAVRTADWVWVGQPDGSRANSPVDTPATPPRQSGTPAPPESSAPDRSRSPSRSNHGSPRPLPRSAYTVITVAPLPDGERKAPRRSIWSASPPNPARRDPVSVPDDAPAPSQSSPVVSGPRDLISISSGSKRTRDTGDDGAGERSSQRRRRSVSPGVDSRRPSASVLGDEPAPSPSPSVSGSRALGSTSSGSKRTRDVEDDGAGETSPQRRRTASAELVAPPTPAVDAAVVTDRVGSADLVAAPAQPVALTVVAAVNIVDIEPAVGPAVAVEAAVEAAVADNPVPLPDRAESRLRARIDALFARSRGRRRADRSAMHRSLESWLLREELIQDLQDRELA